MKITWLGHASFLLESDGYRIVIDPYLREEYPPLHVAAHAAYCSHGHKDHNYIEAVEMLPGGENPFVVTEAETYHDPEQGALRGENIVHGFEAEGIRVVHLGDLGHPLDDAQAAAIGRCDVLLIPIGGVYTIDAAGAKAVADRLAPDVIVPMHYHHAPYGIAALGELEAFTSLYPADWLVRLPGNGFAPGPAYKGKIVIPQYQPTSPA